MATGTGSRPTFEFNRGLLRGGVVLLGTGVLLSLAGATAASVALLSGVRRWVNQLDESPAHAARRRLVQTRHAVMAGSEAWRRESGHAQRDDSRDMASVSGR